MFLVFVEDREKQGNPQFQGNLLWIGSQTLKLRNLMRLILLDSSLLEFKTLHNFAIYLHRLRFLVLCREASFDHVIAFLSHKLNECSGAFGI